MIQRFLNYIQLTRINRPIGIGLLFLPCLFGVFLAEKNSHLDISQLLFLISLFALGSTIMRSAGCVINDIFDQNFDRAVARTKNRPLASGTVSKREALILLTFLLFLGLLILLQFNFATILSGFIALALATIYPLMKRVTYFPQIFLGFAFNFGILMAHLAILGHLSLASCCLYLAAIIWTLIYDSIYAYQDIEDDLKIGVKSSAIKFANNPKIILISLSIAMFILLILTGLLAKLSIHFYLISFAASFLLIQKITFCDFKDSAKCLKVFKDNFWVGLMIAIAIFLG